MRQASLLKRCDGQPAVLQCARPTVLYPTDLSKARRGTQQVRQLTSQLNFCTGLTVTDIFT